MWFGTVLLVALAAVQVTFVTGLEDADFKVRLVRSPQEEIPDEMKPHKPSQPVFESRIARSPNADLIEDMHKLVADMRHELLREKRSPFGSYPFGSFMMPLGLWRSSDTTPPNPPPPVSKGLGDPPVERQSCHPECQ